MNQGFRDIEIYNNKLYIVNDTTLTSSTDGANLKSYNIMPNYQFTVLSSEIGYKLEKVSSNFMDYGGYPATPNNSLNHGLHIVNGHLFISGENLSSMDGHPNQGLGVFCLEPEPAKPMNNLWNVAGPVGYPQPFELDTIICAGNIRKFTVPPSKAADGYKWSYNGTGLKYSSTLPLPGAGPNDFLPFSSDVFISGINNSAIWLYVEESFNGGQLTVEPYSVCNTTTDYQFAKPSSVNLVAAPLPNIQVADSLYFTCVIDSINLLIQSSTPNTTFSWYFNTATINGASYPIYDSAHYQGSYVAFVQEPINGCISSDTTIVGVDKNYPALVGSSSPALWNCYSDSMLITMVDTFSFAPEPAIIHSFNGGQFTGPNPLTIYSEYDNTDFIATYPSNGCTDTAEFFINTDMTPSAALPLNYPSVSVLDCTNDSLLVVLQSDLNSPAGMNYWLSANDTIQDSLWIHVGDAAYLQHDTTNTPGVFSAFYGYFAVNPLNGCESSGFIQVDYNTYKTSISPYTGAALFNCSVDSLLLSHQTNPNAIDEGWDLSGEPELYVSAPGDYVYWLAGMNGCINYDTITVSYINELDFAVSGDTTVCPGDNFTMTANAMGSGPFTYTWSDGQNTISPDGIGGVDTIFIVHAQNAQNCNGSDTLYARITNPILADYSVFSACGAGFYIQADSIEGGAAVNPSDYQFSFENGPITSINNFQVNTAGNFVLTIYDTLGCPYPFAVSTVGNVVNPDVNFLVSTYNASGDTLALINISDFHGFDGVFWEFPSDVELISASDSMAIFTSIDTGWFEIGFTGFLLDSLNDPTVMDTCFFDFTKNVYFGDFKVNYQDSLVSYGIEAVTIFPNPVISGSVQNLTLEIVFGVEQYFKCFTTDNLAQTIPEMYYSGQGELNTTVQLTLPGSLAAGTYYIHIVAEHGAKMVKFTVQ